MGSRPVGGQWAAASRWPARWPAGWPVSGRPSGQQLAGQAGSARVGWADGARGAPLAPARQRRQRQGRPPRAAARDDALFDNDGDKPARGWTRRHGRVAPSRCVACLDVSTIGHAPRRPAHRHLRCKCALKAARLGAPDTSSLPSQCAWTRCCSGYAPMSRPPPPPPASDAAVVRGFHSPRQPPRPPGSVWSASSATCYSVLARAEGFMSRTGVPIESMAQSERRCTRRRAQISAHCPAWRA